MSGAGPALADAAVLARWLQLMRAPSAQLAEWEEGRQRVLASADLLERAVVWGEELVSGLGVMGAPGVEWPTELVEGRDPGGSLAASFALLQAVPALLKWHAARGISGTVSWATLADLVRQWELGSWLHGHLGVAEPWWSQIVVRGDLLEIGRLQYHRYAPGQGYVSRAAAAGVVLDPAEVLVGLHIPPTGPLLPQLVDESIAHAKRLLRKAFPDEHYRFATCGSWLLDPKLAEVLPAESNIVRFQQRFTLVPGDFPASEFVVRVVLRARSVEELEESGTSLGRAVARHLRAGGEWTGRNGFFEWR